MAAVYSHSASDSGGTGSSGHHPTSSASMAPLAIVKTPPSTATPASAPLQPSPSRNGASPAPLSSSSQGLPTSDSGSTLTPASALTSGQTSGGSGPSPHHEPISAKDLAALVVELRSRSSRSAAKKDAEASGNAEQGLHPSSASGQGLNRSTPSSGSSNALDTLDLCHRKIETLPSEVMVMIKEEVVRLALGYNLITKLPEDFKSMSKLRYLNVRANLITTFPAVLSELPALEILDISRNRIRKLPSEPGRLLNLRVLSISNNRLKKLPTYLSQMKHLRILKVEQNPIQWPPPHVSTLPSHPKSSLASARDTANDARKAKDEKEAAALAKKRADDRCMMEWIDDLKRWISTNAESAASNADAERTDKAASRSSSRRVKAANRDAASDEEADASVILAAPPKAVSAPSGIIVSPEPTEESQLPYDMPSPTVRSDTKAAGPSLQPAPAIREVNERLPSPPPPPSMTQPMAPVPPMPPQFSPVTTPQMAREASAFAPTASALSESPASITAGHSRNYSHTLGQASPASDWQNVNAKSAALKSKKSLPDLRENTALLLAERQTSQASPRDEALVSSMDDLSSSQAHGKRGAGAHGAASSSRRPPLPNLVTASASPTSQQSQAPDVQDQARREPPSSFGLTPRRKMSLPGSEAMAEANTEMSDASNMERSESGPQAQGGKASGDELGVKGEQQGAGAAGQARPAASTMVESERNSYFKRLSTLPAYTISKAVPPAVLQFVDATRGLLYALSQIHTALKQYILFAVDDRLSGQFHRVLDIASGSMASLINALDRFDGLSRRGAPEAHVIRGVLIACEASVSMFRKVVSVLALQLGSLQARADPRYTRTLLLLLYGSLGEVRNSWLMMEPHIDAVLPYLAASASSESGTPHLGAPSLPSIAEAISPGGPRTATQSSSTNNAFSASSGPRPLLTRPQRRRQAGSFSAHDVAQGAMMSSESSPQAPSSASADDPMGGASNGPVRRMVRAGVPAALSGLNVSESAPLASAWNPAYPGSAVPSTPGAASVGGAPTTHTAAAPFFPASASNGGISSIGVGLPSAPAATSRFTGLRSMTSSPGTSTRQLVAQQRRAASNAGGTFLAGMGMGIGVGAQGIATAAESVDGGNAEGSRRGGSAAAAIGPTPTTAGLVPLTPWSAGPMMTSAAAGARPIIDGNLVELLAHVTSVASGTWTALLEHLAAIGVKGQPPSGSAGLLDVEGATTPNGPSPTPGDSGSLQAQQSAALSQDDSSQGLSAATNSGTGAMATPASRKLRELRDLSISTSELTRRLQSTLDKVQEEIEAENEAAGQSIGFAVVSGDARRLLEECSRFVKSVIGVLNLSKALSVEHEWPAPIRLSLAQLTAGARDLTIHLHLLSRN